MPICQTGLMRFEHTTPARSGKTVSLLLAHQGLVRRSTYHRHLTDITSRQNHLSLLLPCFSTFHGENNALLLLREALSFREEYYLLHVLYADQATQSFRTCNQALSVVLATNAALQTATLIVSISVVRCCIQPNASQRVRHLPALSHCRALPTVV